MISSLKQSLNHIPAKVMSGLGLMLLFTLTATSSQAAITDIGNAPLISTTTGDVLPNLMYILDDSGSMASDFMPDYVVDSNKCKTTGTSGSFSAACAAGDPPYMTSQFNSLYYSPFITYLPPVNADGTSRVQMDSAQTAGWTNVPFDAYGIYSNTNTSLIPSLINSTIGYRDVAWCNTATPTTADLIDPAVCKKNSQYIYPNNTGTQASSYNQRISLRGHPYYYTVAPGEFCTNKNLTACLTQAAPSAGFTFPAFLRWCNSAARTNCQAKYVETTGYTFAKWSGVESGTSSTGKIRIDADTAGCGGAGQPSCTAPSAMNITDITVDGVRIVATPVPTNLNITNTTNNTDRNTLASRIRDAINNYTPATGDDFTAIVSGNEVIVTRLGAGPFMGTIDVQSSSVTRAAIAGAQAQGEFNVTKVGKDQSGSSANTGRCNTSSSPATNCPVTVQVTQVRVGAPSNTNITTGTITYSTGSLNAGSGSGNTTRYALATLIKDNINTTISSPFDYTATCGSGTAGAGATCTTDQITVTAVTEGTATHGTITITSAVTSNALGAVNTGNLSIGSVTNMGSLTAGIAGVSAKTYTIPNTITQFNGGTPSVNTFSRVDIEPTTLSYPKASSRTDCAGTTCTYAEEMTNFANWHAYYRNRMMLMKTSTSLAFKTIDSRFRVGFFTINSNASYLPIGPFTPTQKTNWYNKLFAAGGNSGTPLRDALSKAGRIYAGKGSAAIGNAADPVQYSCQQNFTILTTDGYWNGGGGLDITGAAITNLDGGATPRPMYEGATSLSNTLADSAKYYYDTDLRTGVAGSAACTGGTRPNGTTGDVCENNVFVTTTDNNLQQHMTTFTLGLGVDAALTYTTDYKTATEGDFYELKQGTLDWSAPVANTQTTIDDLWHAAVNGQGTYFSAKNPTQLSTSLSEALNSIKAKVGAGAAAATSTLNPVSGNNFSYVASYTSAKWIGNLEARTIDVDDGKVSEDATWCLENVAADSCAAPSIVEAVTTGSSTEYVCKTGGATLATCPSPGILDGTDCKVEIATACTGTLQTKVSNTADTRTILMNSSGTLADFTYANIAAVGKNTNFDNAFLAANLPQSSNDFDDLGNPMTPAKKALLNGATLVNYLRGNTGYENRASNLVGPVDNRIYRTREATLGDLIDSTPVYIGAPQSNFSDPGYGPVTATGTFKNAQQSRAGTVYIGSNDGMLHAIDAINGQERWAFIPTMVLDNMWKLARKDYSSQHSYYLNGDLIINDVCTANCTSAVSAVWKTILIGALNGGGFGYFALDITNPASPALLWEFDKTDDSDMGYSYGNPVITKKTDGTWVVLVTSGYNNLTGGNAGKGILYVLNPTTGSIISKYSTGVGTAADPSGLAKINAYVNEAATNNTALYIYGGDLLGNVWRFDINTAQSSSNPFKLAILKDPSGVVQPITTRPELAEINGKRVLYVGTGKYLGVSDIGDTQQQTIYAITDVSVGPLTTFDNPRASATMVNQTLTNDVATSTRKVTSPNPVNFATGRGWYVDFLDPKERQSVPAQLVFGTLLLPTIVPTNTLCSPGGYGWLNFLDYKTGAAVSGNLVSAKTNAPIVGINVLYIKGKPVVNIVTADNPTPTIPSVNPPFTGGTESNFSNHRAIWRELIEEE
jgi:type IV pilus assembly protein PilY1